MDTIRSSSISVGGTCAPSSPARPPRLSAASRPLRRACRVVRRCGPNRRGGRRPARTRPVVADRPGGRLAAAELGVGRLERASSRSRIIAEPAQPPAQPRGALVLLLVGRRSHLGAGHGQAAVSGRRHSPTNSRSASSRRRRYRFGSRSPRQGDKQRPICPYADAYSRSTSLRPQWRSPNSESSCSTSSCASRRPRSGPIVTACPAAGSDATSRIGNAMSSRQRM